MHKTTDRDLNLVALLAGEFCVTLRNELTAEEIAYVNARNAVEPAGSGVCHSHDYCDANMVMQKAFENLGIPTPVDSDNPDDDERFGLWNAAWDIAKDAKFALTLPIAANHLSPADR